jgi:dienelactone hydrolase
MRVRTVLLVSMATAAVSACAAVAWLVRDPRPWFDERRSRVVRVKEEPEVTEGRYRLQAVRVTGASGLAVDLTWKRPVADRDRRMPVAIILGGHVMGAQAARKVGEAPGVMLAAVSYPFAGDPRPSRATFFRQIPAIRRAFLDTPPALMLAHDYLRSRADVDTTRVEAIGVSLGAPFVTIAGALDPRISRVWVLHGSGGSYAPLERSMKRTIGFAPLRAVAAAIANVIIAGPRLAPERWVASIAPRPFIMVNADNDELMPRASVQLLYDRAAQPKEIIWMPGTHIHGDAETIQRLVAIVLARVTNAERTAAY